MNSCSLLFSVLLTAVLAVSASSAPRSHHTPKKTLSQAKLSPDGLTSTQRTSVQAALKSLRKLGTATKVGVSQEDYQSRLIDTKSDVDEDLRVIPKTNAVAIHINKCLDAYQDALDAWNDKEDFHFWDALKDSNLEAPRVVRKYKIAASFNDEASQADDKDELADYAHQVITTACWKVAYDEYNRAEANLN